MNKAGFGFAVVDVADITVGPRRREDFGDIDALARSIKKYGMLHPIVIDQSNMLIVGERRLRAIKQLGWKRVDVRYYDDLDEKDKQAIELEENLRRKSLTEYEQSKKVVERAPVVAESISTKFVEKDSRGRKSAYGVPKKEVAEAIGVSTMTLVNAEQHVAAVEEHRDAVPEIVDAPQQAAIDYARIVKAKPEYRGLPMDEVRRRHKADQRATLDELVRVSDELGLYDADKQAIPVVERIPPKPVGRVSIPLDPIGAAAVLVSHFRGDDLKALIDALARFLPVEAV